MTVEIGLEDLRAFRYRKTQSFRAIVAAIGACGFIFLAFVFMRHVNAGEPDPDPTAAAITGVFVGLSGGAWLPTVYGAYRERRSSREIYEGSIAARGPAQIRVDDEKIEATQAGIVMVFPWSSCVDMSRTPTHFLLFPARLQPIVLPCAALAETPLGALIEARVTASVGGAPILR